MNNVHPFLLTRLRDSATDPTIERRPADLYEFYEHDYIPDPVNGFEPTDAVETFASIDITWNGIAYRRSVVSRGAIDKNMGQQTNTCSITFSNIDSYLATFAQTTEIEGMWVVIRYVERDITAGSLVLFVGKAGKPSTINNKSFSISATQDVIDLNAELPLRTYSAQDIEGRSPSDPHYEGIRFVAIAGSLSIPTIIPAQNTIARLFGQRDTIYVTKQWSSHDATPEGNPIREVLGRAQVELQPFLWADKGVQIAALWAACAGPVQAIEQIKTRTSGWSDLVNSFNIPPAPAEIHLGDLGGTGTNAAFPIGWPTSGLFSHLAYVSGSSIGSTLEQEDSPPTVTALVIGRRVPTPNGSGVYPSIAVESTLEWTDNPVNLARWIFIVSGASEEFMEDTVNYLTSLWCDEPLLDESNDERAFVLAADLPQTGNRIVRLISSGVINPRFIRYWLGDPVDEPWLTEPIYETYTPEVMPSAYTIQKVYRKRYTFNAPIAERVKSIDFLYKVLYPAFRGFHRINSKGKVEIHSEKSADNCLLRAAPISAPVSPYSGAIAVWHLDEASGTRNDSVGTNHLADNNTVTTAAAKLGANAAQFTAANSEYLSIADNADLSTGNIDFTVGLWVKLDSLAGIQVIANKGSWGTTQEYLVDYDGTASFRFRFTVTSDGGAGLTVVSANSLGAPVVGTWYQITAWHDSVLDTINIQVNGGTVDSASHTTGGFNGTGPFELGRNVALGRYLDGKLDEVAFWKRTLTGSERGQLYNSGAGVAYAITAGFGLSVDDVTPWKENLLLQGKLLIGGTIGLTTSEVRRVVAATFTTDGNAITLTAGKTGAVTATASGATLTGGTVAVQASGTVTIGGTPGAGDTVTTTIGGIAIIYAVVADETTASVAAMIAYAINADTKLKRFIKATVSGAVVTVKAKWGVLNLDAALVNSHTAPRAAPVSGPTLAASAGTMAAGTYKVAYAYVTAVGRTTISPVTSQVLTANQKIDVTSLGALPGGVTSVNWYVSAEPNVDKLVFYGNNAGGAFSITALPSKDNPGIPAHNTTGEECIRVGMSFATNTQGATILAQAGLTRGNANDYNYPLGSEQSSINQIKGNFRDAKNDFALTPFTVNDPVHQLQIGSGGNKKIKPLEVDYSGVDNWHQAFRLANSAISKNREGDWFNSLSTANGEALLLEEGDLITASDASGGLINVATRIEALSISPTWEVSIRKARKYSTLMFSDDVRQHDIPLPSNLRYVATADTQFVPMDLPYWRDTDSINQLGFHLALARSASDGDWRGAAIYSDASGAYVALTAKLETQVPIGDALTAMSATANTYTIDTVSTVRIQIVSPFGAVPLVSTTEDLMKAGANKYALGINGRWEIGHFQTATLVGGTDDTWDLTVHLRGRHGTEHNTSNHTTADEFVLLTDSTGNDTGVQFIPIDYFMLARTFNLKAVTTNQDVADATAESFTWEGEILRPLATINHRDTLDSEDSRLIEFEGRTRFAGGLRSYQSGPLNEEKEEYVVDIYSADGLTLKRSMNVIVGMTQPALLEANGPTKFDKITANTLDSGVDFGPYTAVSFQKIEATGNRIDATLSANGGFTAAIGIVPDTFNWRTATEAQIKAAAQVYAFFFDGGPPSFAVHEYGVSKYTLISPSGGNRVTIIFSGSEVRVYRNWTGANSVPVYISPKLATFPLMAIAFVEGTVAKVSSITMTTNPYPKTVYSEAQQIEDFGSVQATYVRDYYQKSSVVGNGVKTRLTL